MLRCMSLSLALLGPCAVSDLSPECAPKRTFANASEFMGSRPKRRRPFPSLNLHRCWNLPLFGELSVRLQLRWRLTMRAIILPLTAGVIAVSQGLGFAQTTPGPTPPPQPVLQVQPQLNTPGPQLNVTQPSNPARQSAPLTTPPAATAPSSEPSVRSRRHRSTRHREPEPSETTSTSVSPGINERGSSCSYNHCVRRCMDTGQVFFIVGKKTGSSCQDQCKHQGRSDRDYLRMYIDP
jgi:hypothetical protein